MNKLVIVLSILFVISSIGFYFVGNKVNNQKNVASSAISAVPKDTSVSSSISASDAKVDSKVENVTMEQFEEKLTGSYWVSSSPILINDVKWDYQFSFKKTKNRELSGGILFEGVIYVNDSINLATQAVGKLSPGSISGKRLYFTKEQKDTSAFYGDGRFSDLRYDIEYSIEIQSGKVFLVVTRTENENEHKVELNPIKFDAYKKFAGKWTGKITDDKRITVNMDLSKIEDPDIDFGSFLSKLKDAYNCDEVSKVKVRMLKETIMIATVGKNYCEMDSAVFKLVLDGDKMLGIGSKQNEPNFDIEFKRN